MKTLIVSLFLCAIAITAKADMVVDQGCESQCVQNGTPDYECQQYCTKYVPPEQGSGRSPWPCEQGSGPC